MRVPNRSRAVLVFLALCLLLYSLHALFFSRTLSTGPDLARAISQTHVPPDSAPGLTLFACVTNELDELARFRLLLSSLYRFFHLSDVSSFVLAVPEQQQQAVLDFLEQFHREQKSTNRIRFQVISERDVIPELHAPISVSSSTFPSRHPGYILQQLLKLAIVDWIHTPFYLTLDTDVLLTRPVSLHDLLPNGKALTNMEGIENHLNWWQAADHVLNAQKTVLRETVAFGATPALMNRETVLKLGRYLERLSERPWRAYLLSHLNGWTEYSVYYTFAKMAGLLEKKYEVTVNGVYGESIWTRAEYDNKDLTALFRNNQGFFIVIQSTTGVSAEEIWRRIQPFYQ
eukprot:TRINITY_DN3475_c0_g1_i1.p1 TRINITY_DN3475_c0_g1~~TRINITY_DN3475_c0_g1_i1.p1  ORF type:complete len:344 (+),score=59.95 TRINITY_DN3475_c0_g1_i1:57-1088(+)